MARTWLRQDAQMQASQTFNQALTVGSTLQSSAVSIEDDLNALRTQVSQVLDATGAGNWYDPVYTTGTGKKRSVKQLNTGLDTIETKTLLARVTQSTVVAVPASQNYVILSFSGGQTPSTTIAIGATTVGAVVAQSTTNGSGFAANELTVVTGTDTANPKNLCLVRNSTTGQAVEVSGSDVFALIQVESTATDGAAFNDTSAGNRAKLSFVTINYSTGALVACPAANIGGVSIQYSYVLRNSLSSMPEQYFIGNSSFADNIGSVDVTLQNAYNNQAAIVNQTSNQTVAIGNTFTQAWTNAGGTSTLLALNSTSSTTSTTISSASLAINTTSVPTSTKGISVATSTASQQINLGVTANQIDSASTLTIASVGTMTLVPTGNILINPSGSATLSDLYRSSSTWTSTGVRLSNSSAEWSSYKSTFGGEVSLLNAIVAATAASGHSILYANVTAASISAGTNVTGAGGSPNIDTQLFNYSGSTFIKQVKVYVNGQLMRPGANAAAGNDVYPGTTPANGDLMFAFALKNTATHTDVITMEIVQNALYPT